MYGKQKKQIIVIDGMGGGLGSQIISNLKAKIKAQAKITALGTNAMATSRMLQAGADQGATGENAVRTNINNADLIVGPLGILMPNAMLGEITPLMAEWIGFAKCKKILLPVNQPHFHLVGFPTRSMTELMEDLIKLVEEELKHNDKEE